MHWLETNDFSLIDSIGQVKNYKLDFKNIEHKNNNIQKTNHKVNVINLKRGSITFLIMSLKQCIKGPVTFE